MLTYSVAMIKWTFTMIKNKAVIMVIYTIEKVIIIVVMDIAKEENWRN